MTTSERPLFVYLQRPDNGEWVVAGRYLPDAHADSGSFRYAPSYVEAGLSWAIDPVNLPFVPGVDYTARRYGGLHDVLRDASPDSWGQILARASYGEQTTGWTLPSSLSGDSAFSPSSTTFQLEARGITCGYTGTIRTGCS